MNINNLLRKKTRRSQKGIGAAGIAFLLVGIGALLAAMAQFMTQDQHASNYDLLGAKAYQAAQAGIEYGAYQSIRGGGCANATLSFPNLTEFTVAITCSRITVTEGASSINVDSWISVACNQGSCPGTASAGYIERRVSAQIAR